MSTEVQPVTALHVAGLRACIDSIARERKFLAQVEAVPLEQMRQFVENNIAHDLAQFVAADGGRVVGWCDIVPGWAYAFQHCGTLGMGVLAAYRGQGIGQRLMAACIARARQRGITRIELQVRIDNTRAIALYQRMGFVPEGRKRNGMCIDGRYFDMVEFALVFDAGKEASASATDSGAAQQ